MAEHEPIDEPESRFLEHEKDLLALRRKSPQPVIPTTSASPPDPSKEKMLLIAALLIPPIAISLVPGILAKLVIMAILAFTGFVILESQPATSSTTTDSIISERTESINKAKMAELGQEQCKRPTYLHKYPRNDKLTPPKLSHAHNPKNVTKSSNPAIGEIDPTVRVYPFHHSIFDL